MINASHRKGLALATLALAGTLVRAEAPGLDAAFKMRAGYGLTTNQDNLDRRTLGLGFEVGYGNKAHRWGLELGYQYKPGNQFNVDPGTVPTGLGGALASSPQADSRKNQVGGIAARFSFEKELGASPWSMRAGLQLGGANFRQEYIGDLTGKSYEDTFNGIATKNALSPSPYVGVVYAIDPEEAVEINFLYLGYTSANYVHVAGSVPGSIGGNTALDYVSSTRHAMPHVELCYVLRF